MKSSILRFFAFAIIFVLASNIVDAQLIFRSGKLQVRVDNYGAIRIYTTEGLDTLQQINRMNVMIAGNTNQVFDYKNDGDIEVANVLVAAPALSNHEIVGTYNNAYSGLPPNVNQRQNVYGWTNQSYIIVKSLITNKGTTATPILAGLEIINYGDQTWENDKIFFDTTNKVLTQVDIKHTLGIKILGEATTSAQIMMWFTGYHLADTNLYKWLYKGTISKDTLLTDAEGGLSILGGKSLSMTANAKKEFTFAVAVGATRTEMLTNLQAAVTKYNSFPAFVKSDIKTIPSDFVLEQNFPNPFNPSTKISFGLSKSTNVVLKVFNNLGQEVATLVNESLQAGSYEANFDASNLPSGIYIYSLRTNGGVITKKMTLLK
ncbi:MAG: T9SS type A sorting domain-containing protein [Ignavibacteria bacterium]|nr:T9SS type A sorting domain-containing protein [Ignavibacteria bacterium]